MNRNTVRDPVAAAFARYDAGLAAAPVPVRVHPRGARKAMATFATLKGTKAEFAKAALSTARNLVKGERFADEDGFRSRQSIVDALNALLEQIGCLGDEQVVAAFVWELRRAVEVAGLRAFEADGGWIR